MPVSKLPKFRKNYVGKDKEDISNTTVYENIQFSIYKPISLFLSKLQINSEKILALQGEYPLDQNWKQKNWYFILLGLPSIK